MGSACLSLSPASCSFASKTLGARKGRLVISRPTRWESLRFHEEWRGGGRTATEHASGPASENYLENI